MGSFQYDCVHSLLRYYQVKSRLSKFSFSLRENFEWMFGMEKGMGKETLKTDEQ